MILVPRESSNNRHFCYLNGVMGEPLTNRDPFSDYLAELKQLSVFDTEKDLINRSGAATEGDRSLVI